MRRNVLFFAAALVLVALLAPQWRTPDVRKGGQTQPLVADVDVDNATAAPEPALPAKPASADPIRMGATHQPKARPQSEEINACIREQLRDRASGDPLHDARQSIQDIAHATKDLRASPDMGLRLFAHLMRVHDDSEPVTAAEADALFSAGTDDPVMLWAGLQACVQQAGLSYCNDDELVARARRVDPQNSEVWAVIAGLRANRGDLPGALAATRIAASSARSDVYFIEHVQLSMRAIAAIGAGSPAQAMIVGFGVAAGSSGITPVVSLCSEHAPDSLQWRDACRDYGQLLAHAEQKSILQHSVGLFLQLRVAELNQNMALADELNRQRVDSVQAIDTAASQLPLYDSEVLADYIKIFASLGEARAIHYLEDELSRRIEAGEFDACYPPQTRPWNRG